MKKEQGIECKRLRPRDALIGAFLVTMPVKAEALELPPGTDWYAGAQAWQKATLTETNEKSAIYYISDSSEGGWFHLKEGFEASTHGGDQEAALEAMQVQYNTINEQVVQASPKTLTVCRFHNHPTRGEYASVENNGHGYVHGVSMNDLQADYVFAHAVQNIPMEKHDVDFKLYAAVFDTYGLWYYSGYEAKTYDNEAAQLLNQTQQLARKWLAIELASDRGEEFLQSYNKKFGTNFTYLGPENVDQMVTYLLEVGEVDVEYDKHERSLDIRGIISHLYQLGVIPELNDTLNAFWVPDFQVRRDFEDPSGLLSRFTQAVEAAESEERPEVIQAWLPEVYSMYEKVGSDVRFVPYNQIPSEPPCAGPHYSPEAKK